MAELKLGCLLYLGDFEAAQASLAEVFAVGRTTAEYQALDLALSLMQNEALDAQVSALVSLFGEERWESVVAWIDGSCFIWDMELIHPERFSARHQALLRSHQRINQALIA